MNPVDPATTPPPIDETSPSGALFTYNRRLLQVDEAKVAAERAKFVALGELEEDDSVLGEDALAEEHNRLRRLFFKPGEYTTSDVGAGPGFFSMVESSLTYVYTLGDADDASWSPVMQTWANGTDDANSIYAPGFTLNDDLTMATAGTACASGTSLYSAAMYALLDV